MKIHFNPKDFLRKFKITSTIALGNHVKPVLCCNVKIVADEKIGVVLMAADNTVGIRISVDAGVETSGEALLPPKEFQKILELAKKSQLLTLERTKTGIAVMGDNGEQWTLHTQLPDKFTNDVDEFTETAYHEISAATLYEMIGRTMFAVSKQNHNNSYLLSGVCFESDGDKITAIATCSRRLATQDANGKCINDHKIETALLPVNALKLLSKVLKDTNATGNVKMAACVTALEEKRTTGTAYFQYGNVTIFTQLLDGQFPNWRVIIPNKDGRIQAKTRCETLRTALKRIITTKKDTEVLFTFQPGCLTLANHKKESGESKVTIPVTCNDTVDFVLDADFMKDYLHSLDADTSIDIFISPDNKPILFETDDGDYRYIVSTMIR